MQIFKEVEAAKALMREAVDWSVMHWLSEKKRVRKAADLANEVLDEYDREVKSAWPDDLKAAYAELTDEAKPANKARSDDAAAKFAQAVKQADAEAYRARMDAEDTFDRAEQRLSTSLAREGTRKAITSWELHERAIVLSEQGMKSSRTAS